MKCGLDYELHAASWEPRRGAVLTTPMSSMANNLWGCDRDAGLPMVLLLPTGLSQGYVLV